MRITLGPNGEWIEELSEVNGVVSWYDRNRQLLRTRSGKRGLVLKAKDLCKAEPTTTAPTAELVKEHTHLVGVLRSPSHADDRREAKKQARELREYRESLKKKRKKGAKMRFIVKARRPIKGSPRNRLGTDRRGRTHWRMIDTDQETAPRWDLEEMAKRRAVDWDPRTGRIVPRHDPEEDTRANARAEEIRRELRCACGAASVGAWTGQGVHHGKNRCARVVDTSRATGPGRNPRSITNRD